MTSKMIIAGAGISGIRSALDLAELGHTVILTDKASFTGGILTKLDHQFPDNHCGMCRILPMINREPGREFCLRKGIIHQNIEFLPGTEITDVKGSSGNFTVSLSKKPTGINRDKCSGCGACIEACPVSLPDDFNEACNERKAIFLPNPYLSPESLVIDFSNCTKCNACIDICNEDAIDLTDTIETIIVENTTSVILATGTGMYDPSASDLYGFNRLPNVITGTGIERIISSSGPYKGKFIRPSDKKEVKKIAWLQCIGSRNIMENADYCSSVCCMFAVKEAVFAAEAIGSEADTAIFYMDMRTYGRDFQRYRDKAEKDHGTRFIRCRIHSIEPYENTDDLKLSYVNRKGELIDEVFDLVVLSTGKKQGLVLPEFASLDGVFSTNNRLEFKDISESLISADAAAADAGNLIQDKMHPEIDIHISGNTREIIQKAIVVGGGPAGLSAALAIVAAGYHVDIVEKSDVIGGNLPLISQAEQKASIQKLVDDVGSHPNITIHYMSEVTENAGFPGMFRSKVQSPEGNFQIDHGTTIIATGGHAAETSAYNSGEHDKIISIFELTRRVNTAAFKSELPESIAFIQCAGSREEPSNYCSRICCTKALENCIKIKTHYPETDIYVFYRDIMTYGASEKLYTEARKKGVLFVPFDLSEKPTVSVSEKGLSIGCYDPVMGETLTINPDLIALSNGVRPADNKTVTETFRLNMTTDGFIKEADYKWRPVDTGREGIFICGLARLPLKADEAINEGKAAAVRALRILSQREISASKVSAIVRKALCTKCELCIDACPFEARYTGDGGFIMVDPISCQGCGSCAAVCPNSATITGDYEDNTVMQQIETLF